MFITVFSSSLQEYFTNLSVFTDAKIVDDKVLNKQKSHIGKKQIIIVNLQYKKP